MYLGGMAGTGKSQVLKALQFMFELQGYSNEFLVLAVTPVRRAGMGAIAQVHL
jgi:putative protein kinase ArgK-like GTPase of G3E family